MNLKNLESQNSNSILQVLFLSLPQILLPFIIFIAFYIVFKDKSNLQSWGILLIGSSLIVGWFTIITIFFLKKKLMILNNLKFSISLLITFESILWATYFTHKVFYIIVFVIFIAFLSFFTCKFLIKLLTNYNKINLTSDSNIFQNNDFNLNNKKKLQKNIKKNEDFINLAMKDNFDFKDDLK